MLGVLPLFTWGTRADGFKMASRWWQRLDCSKGGLCVPPTPAVQLTLAVKQHLSISSLYLLSSSPLSNTAQSHYWGFLLWMGLCTCLCVISSLSFHLFPCSSPLPLSLLTHLLCCFPQTHTIACRWCMAAVCVHCLCDGLDDPLLDYSVAPPSWNRKLK